MAKTQWTDGSWLIPAFMVSFFGTTAGTGHDHKGLDNDGSSPKIGLTDAVTGILPEGNIKTDFTIPIVVSTADFDVEFTGDLEYSINSNIYTFVFPEITGTQAGVNSGAVNIRPVTGDWPTAFVLLAGYYFPAKVYNNVVSDNGSIRFPADPANAIVVENRTLTAFAGTGIKGCRKSMITSIKF